MKSTTRVALWMSLAASLVACAFDATGGRPAAADGTGVSPPLGAGVGGTGGAASADVGGDCASGPSSPPPPSADIGGIALTGDGIRVSLSGAPADPAYSATYPVEGVTAMAVRVQANATLTAKCTTRLGVIACHDHPFYSRARGEVIEVFDVYGKLVLAANKPVAPSTSCPPPDAGRRSCAFADDIRQQFCNDVNAASGSNHTIDCGVLEDVTPPSSPSPSGTAIARACLPLVEAATSKARDAFAECGDDGSAQVATWHSSARAQLLAKGACTGSPLVVDLDGTGLTFSSIADGVGFDLFGDGAKMQTAWPRGNVAFLVLDANGDGRIVATELFGSATDGGRWPDGFEALRVHDTNHDLLIDRRDPIFGALALWTDRDRNGESRASELSSLADHSIEVLDLRASRIARPSSLDLHGNEIPLLSTYRTASGRSGALADVFLRFVPR